MIDDPTRFFILLGMMMGLIVLVIWGPNFYDDQD